MLDTAAGGWYHISGAGIRQAEKRNGEGKQWHTKTHGRMRPK